MSFSSVLRDDELERWHTRGMVPERSGPSNIEEEDFASRSDRGSIDLFGEPYIQSDKPNNGMGYSSLAEMTNFCLKLQREENYEERIRDAVQSILNTPAISTIPEEGRDHLDHRSEASAEKLSLVECVRNATPLLPMDLSLIEKEMSKEDFEKLKPILTAENLSRFSRLSHKVDPSRSCTEMTGQLLSIFIYFMILIRRCSVDEAYEYFDLCLHYYRSISDGENGHNLTKENFIARFRKWQYKNYKAPAIYYPKAEFVDKCYLAFVAARVLWVWQAVAPSDWLTEEDCLAWIKRFGSCPEVLQDLWGYWYEEYKEELSKFPTEKSKARKQQIQQEMAEVDKQFKALPKAENTNEDKTKLSNIRDKLVKVTASLKMKSISEMLGGFRIRLKMKKSTLASD